MTALSSLEPGTRVRWVCKRHYPEMFGRQATVVEIINNNLLRIEWTEQPSHLGPYWHAPSFLSDAFLSDGAKLFEIVPNDWDDCLELL